LSRALVILSRESSSPAASAQWKKVHNLVVDGMSLASAMAQSPETFPRVYVAMVEAGEAGGFLDVVLAQIAEFQSRDKELRSKVLTAMLYPIILFVLATIVLTVMLVYFIPKFQTVFNSFHGHLPLITQLIICASHAVIHYGLFAAVGLVVIIFSVRTWFASEKGRRVWEGLVLRAPIVGPLNAQFAMARFCRMLGTMLGAGVPLVQSLNVARRSIGNQILVDAVSQSIERVQQGGRLGESLANCKNLFPGSVLEMVAVAEESGKLDGELIRIANVTELDLDRNLKTAVAFAEPAMLFVIAVLVGFIFIGMLLPVLTMGANIK
jgi:type II secretory pathway component PulF